MFECSGGDGGDAESRHADVSRALVFDVRVDYKAPDFCGRRVDGAEAEYVQQHEAAVVYEVLDGAAREGQVCVGEGRDARDAVHAVDVGENAVEGEVRGYGGLQGGEGDCEEGDLVGEDGGRRGAGGKELEVDCVGVVCVLLAQCLLW